MDWNMSRRAIDLLSDMVLWWIPCASWLIPCVSLNFFLPIFQYLGQFRLTSSLCHSAAGISLQTALALSLQMLSYMKGNVVSLPFKLLSSCQKLVCAWQQAHMPVCFAPLPQLWSATRSFQKMFQKKIPAQGKLYSNSLPSKVWEPTPWD